MQRLFRTHHAEVFMQHMQQRVSPTRHLARLCVPGPSTGPSSAALSKLFSFCPSPQLMSSSSTAVTDETEGLLFEGLINKIIMLNIVTVCVLDKVIQMTIKTNKRKQNVVCFF